MDSPTIARSFKLPGTRAIVRDPDEMHRASTPLELLFDLCFVVGVAQASAALHHELAEGHIKDGTVGFALGFFAVWWGWMNYTWFSSAHDSADLTHRLLTLVQMAGALVVAAGIGRVVEGGDLTIATTGYAVMRVGLLASWLRVAIYHREGRTRALRYSIGIVILQVLWLGKLGINTSENVSIAGFVFLVMLEMLVPVWAERSLGEPLFHAEHIEERYGLFTIIVLGETILAASLGLQTSIDEVGLSTDLMLIAATGLVIAFASWWLYFEFPGHLSPSKTQSFRWGYAHVVIFSSLAALGAGIHLAAEAVHSHISPRTAALAVAIPVGGFLFGLILTMMATGQQVMNVRIVPKFLVAVGIVISGLTASVTTTIVLAAVAMTGLVIAIVRFGPSE